MLPPDMPGVFVDDKDIMRTRALQAYMNKTYPVIPQGPDLPAAYDDMPNSSYAWFNQIWKNIQKPSPPTTQGPTAGAG
jgi:hypothetical protein